MKPENLRVIHEAMLADVEERGGTGTEAAVPGLKIGGKTGTAEVEHGGRIVDKTTWFASFAPVDRPKWAVVVMVESGASGGKTCAPVAKKIYEALQRREREGSQKPALPPLRPPVNAAVPAAGPDFNRSLLTSVPVN